ncbi:MAG: MBL fold metallo-hydrolase [Gemmatimonadota bacterium]|nr:MBL fold metallo-hydrolase [Gemmatimonadota bacterium]MDH3423059.1 MBL fold metallo-hydrolase [Gemmatimonadota bacterium]
MLTRREFIGRTSSCAAHIGLMAAASPALIRRGWLAQERFPVAASAPWGRLVRVADGVWALVSDPLQDRTTLCNGGIIAGRSGVAVIESFSTVRGAEWMMEQALDLTGRFPTHVILSHYHSDHTAGLAGSAAGGGPVVLTTEQTRDLIRERIDGVPAQVLDDAVVLVGRRPTELELGDRSVILVPRRGHTESDLSIEVPDASVMFCGDLVWNGMFPNYVDATPSRLSREVRVMRLLGTTTYVPGHGPLADVAAVDRYIGLLDSVEAAARAALERGMSADEAGAEYSLPTGLEGWTLFSPNYFSRAIGAWMTELQA